MLFKNANIFVNGRFQHGSFRVENGRFTEILTTVPDEPEDASAATEAA